MSRCIVCNAIMSEQELTHKYPLTGQYTEMCFDCLAQHEAMIEDTYDDDLLVIDNTYKFNGDTSDDMS